MDTYIKMFLGYIVIYFYLHWVKTLRKINIAFIIYVGYIHTPTLTISLVDVTSTEQVFITPCFLMHSGNKREKNWGKAAELSISDAFGCAFQQQNTDPTNVSILKMMKDLLCISVYMLNISCDDTRKRRCAVDLGLRSIGDTALLVIVCSCGPVWGVK